MIGTAKPAEAPVLKAKDPFMAAEIDGTAKVAPAFKCAAPDVALDVAHDVLPAAFDAAACASEILAPPPPPPPKAAIPAEARKTLPVMPKTPSPTKAVRTMAPASPSPEKKAAMRAALIWEGLRAFARSGGQGATAAHFKAFDVDFDGKLDREEFKSALTLVGFRNPSDLVVDEVMRRARLDLDLSGRGVIDCEAFAAALLDAEKNRQ